MVYGMQLVLRLHHDSDDAAYRDAMQLLAELAKSHDVYAAVVQYPDGKPMLIHEKVDREFDAQKFLDWLEKRLESTPPDDA